MKRYTIILRKGESYTVISTSGTILVSMLPKWNYFQINIEGIGIKYCVPKQYFNSFLEYIQEENPSTYLVNVTDPDWQPKDEDYFTLRPL